MTSKANNAKDRISHYFPYIVGGTAIVIRFFYLWSFWTNHPFSQKLISDARIFDDWALRAERKLILLHQSSNLNDLRVPPSNRLEALKGNRRGQHSIRINDQWRICFE